MKTNWEACKRKINGITYFNYRGMQAIPLLVTSHPSLPFLSSFPIFLLPLLILYLLLHLIPLRYIALSSSFIFFFTILSNLSSFFSFFSYFTSFYPFLFVCTKYLVQILQYCGCWHQSQKVMKKKISCENIIKVPGSWIPPSYC